MNSSALTSREEVRIRCCNLLLKSGALRIAPNVRYRAFLAVPVDVG